MKQRVTGMVVAVLCLVVNAASADEPESADRPDAFATVLQPAFARRCVKCHGRDGKAKGKVDLLKLKSVGDLTAAPELVRDLIDALDSEYMPPEDEPPLGKPQRQALVAELRTLLRSAVAARSEPLRAPIRRMNRFQYNNAVQDLFQLNVAVFPLPERILREYGAYFQPQSGKMPENAQGRQPAAGQVATHRAAVGRRDAFSPRPAGRARLRQPRRPSIALAAVAGVVPEAQPVDRRKRRFQSANLRRLARVLRSARQRRGNSHASRRPAAAKRTSSRGRFAGRSRTNCWTATPGT